MNGWGQSVSALVGEFLLLMFLLFLFLLLLFLLFLLLRYGPWQSEFLVDFRIGAFCFF